MLDEHSAHASSHSCTCGTRPLNKSAVVTSSAPRAFGAALQAAISVSALQAASALAAGEGSGSKTGARAKWLSGAQRRSRANLWPWLPSWASIMACILEGALWRCSYLAHVVRMRHMRWWATPSLLYAFPTFARSRNTAWLAIPAAHKQQPKPQEPPRNDGFWTNHAVSPGTHGRHVGPTLLAASSHAVRFAMYSHRGHDFSQPLPAGCLRLCSHSVSRDGPTRWRMSLSVTSGTAAVLSFRFRFPLEGLALTSRLRGATGCRGARPGRWTAAMTSLFLLECFPAALTLECFPAAFTLECFPAACTLESFPAAFPLHSDCGQLPPPPNARHNIAARA